MEILNAILAQFKEDVPVREVRRGLHWTAVVSRRCGLASTISQGNGCNNEIGDGSERAFTEMSARELARFSLHEATPMASLGLAAINSLLDVDPDRHADVDGLKLIKEMARDRNVSIIGHFPLLDDLAREAANLWIIEKQPRQGDYTEEQGKDLLPQSDIVVISSTTLINHTLSGILDRCREGSVKMLLGPSTPLTEVLYDYGIDILSGSVVTNADAVLRSVGEGVSFMQLKKRGGVRFVSMVKDRDAMMRRLAG
jgi:uncharacterized protein (DUF4213/DUF364 family)